MWTWVHITREWDKRMTSLSRESTRGQVAAVSRKKQHQVGWKRNLQPSGAMVPQKTNQTDLLPCLGSEDSFFIPSGVERATHTLLHEAVSRLQVQAGPSLWEIPPVLRSWCGEGRSRMKTARDEDDSTKRMQRNAVESQAELNYKAQANFMEFEGGK